MSTSLDHASADLLAAARSYQDGEVRASIAAHPALGALDIFTACVAGRLDDVERLLAGAPGRASARDPIAGWTPLLYASGSPLFSAGAEATEAGLRIIDRLLAAGADPSEAAEAPPSSLRGRPPPEPLHPGDVFLGACLRGEEGLARSLLDASPNLVSALGDEARALPVRAAFEGRVPELRTMAKLGFDLDVEQSEGGTALHVAAWQGRAEVVGALLALGASPRARDRGYGGTPRDWARHGRANRRRPPEDYDQLELMLARAEPAGRLVPGTPA